MFKAHINYYSDLYLVLISWALVGAFLPKSIAIVYPILTFLLILRTQDLSKIFIAFIATLIFSDSRSSMFAFAATAKIGIVISTFVFIISNWELFKGQSNSVFRFFLPFLVFAVTATLWSVDTFNALQKSASYGLIFFIVPSTYQSALSQRKAFSKDVLIFIFLIIFIGLIVNLVNPSFTTLADRFRGLLGNPNGLGIFSTLTFALFFLTMKKNGEDILRSPFGRIFLVVFFTSLLLSGSRTALISIALFVGLNYLKVLSNWVVLFVFLSFIISYEFLLTRLPDLIMTFGLEEYFRLDTLEEGSGRFVAWDFAWKRIQEVFYVGGGYGYTEYVYLVYHDSLSILGHQGNAHNSYLTLWLDTGLIGLSLMLIGMFRSVLAGVAKSTYTLPLVFSILFSSFFESWLSASLNPFTTLFIVVLTLLQSSSEKTLSNA